MPSFSRASAALIPSHVDAILMRILSRDVPAASYIAMISWAFLMVASVSNDRRASTSVETLPGTIFRISCPKRTSSWSMIASGVLSFADAMAFSTMCWYSSC